jgi:hypothetical protein
MKIPATLPNCWKPLMPLIPRLYNYVQLAKIIIGYGENSKDIAMGNQQPFPQVV